MLFRYAINAGLPALTVPGATSLFTDGDTATVDIATGTYRNNTTGAEVTVPALPGLVLEILASGGVLARLADQGYLPKELAGALRSGTIPSDGTSGA